MLSPTNITIMPSESLFKRHADLARDALKNFAAVRDLNSSTVVKAAIVELIDATVSFNNFVPFFVPHPLFQEIPPAVHSVLQDFLSKHPSFEMPPSFSKVAGLDARVKDFVTNSNGKRGKSFPLFFFSFY